MSQPFLEARQRRLLITGFDIGHPIRRQPRCFQPRRKQILISHAPQDLALGARHDAGRKQSRGSAVQRAIAGAGDLVQGAKGETTARQARVHLRQPEGQNPTQAAIGRLKATDFFAQKIDGG
jgi:hypothetical protein